MKYEYITATGKTEIEVDEQFYDLLIALDKEECNSNRKHSRRHSISLDNADYEGEWFSDGTDLLGNLIQKETRERLHSALSELTLDQKTLIQQIYFEGISASEIARYERVDKSAISHRLARAYKKLEKYLK